MKDWISIYDPRVRPWWRDPMSWVDRLGAIAITAWTFYWLGRGGK